MTADVAEQLLRGAMVGERHAAIRALGDVAARRTLQRGGPAAAIEEEDDLFLLLQALRDRLLELLREDLRALVLAVLRPHIDDAHDGHLLVVHAQLHFQQRVFAATGVVEALHRRRGRTEHDDSAFHLAAHDRDIARVVTRRFLLLVGMLVLLVHDDEPQRIDRRKDRRARADDNSRAALTNLVPFIVTLARREMAVQHGDQRLKLA